MKWRSNFSASPFARLFTLGVAALAFTACGDDDARQIVTTVDAGNPLSPTDTSESSGTLDSTSGSPTAVGEGTVPAPTTSEDSSAHASTTGGTEASATSSAAPAQSTDPVVGETSSEPAAPQTTEAVEPCPVPSFSVFSRSDTDASWDDNDFSSVLVDTSQCPPAVNIDVTWPHEEGWENGDPSEANHEQVHFTLDSYGATNLVDKEITATIELVADERGPNANAGGYLVSIVSVSTFDRITVIPPAVEPGTDPDASAPEPQVITETGYSEAESAPEDRILLRRVGDRATLSFRLPAKTEAVDSYDPERVLKTNLRFYNVYDVPSVPVEPEPLDAGVSAAPGTSEVVDFDAGGDASLAEPFVAANLVAPSGGNATPVYDYLTSRFAISKFMVSDVPASAR